MFNNKILNIGGKLIKVEFDKNNNNVILVDIKLNKLLPYICIENFLDMTFGELIEFIESQYTYHERLKYLE
jgi:hypothetical protein